MGTMSRRRMKDDAVPTIIKHLQSSTRKQVLANRDRQQQSPEAVQNATMIRPLQKYFYKVLNTNRKDDKLYVKCKG